MSPQKGTFKSMSINLNLYIYKYKLITSRKTTIKIKAATDEGNSRNQIWHWKNDENGLALQRWFCVRVELMAW